MQFACARKDKELKALDLKKCLHVAGKSVRGDDDRLMRTALRKVRWTEDQVPIKGGA